MPIIQTTKQLRPRDEHDHYPTPLPFALAALEPLNKPTCILDIGAGAGVFGQAARELWTGVTITGIELRAVTRPKWYDFWYLGSLFDFDSPPAFDLVMGNLPYKYAEQGVRIGVGWLEQGGVMQNLLRLAFLEGQARGAGFYRELPPYRVNVCSARPSFTGNGKTDATAYANFYWRKGWQGETALGWTMTSAEQSQKQLQLFEGAA